MRTYAIDNFFDTVLNKGINELIDHNFTNQVPPANIIEKDDAYIIELFVPGLTKEHFDIKVDKLQLHISTKSTEQTEVADEIKILKKEFDYSNFNRTFSLNDEIDYDQIKATYDAGILTVELAKKEEAKEKGPQFIHID